MQRKSVQTDDNSSRHGYKMIQLDYKCVR